MPINALSVVVMQTSNFHMCKINCCDDLYNLQNANFPGEIGVVNRNILYIHQIPDLFFIFFQNIHKKC